MSAPVTTAITSAKPARPSRGSFLARATRPVRAWGRAAVFFLKVFPMLPSRPIDWVTQTPVIEKVQYPSGTGMVDGEVYRPANGGPFPGMVVCLGVVPFGVDHPQVSVLGKALARAGFAALLYWSPAMRNLRLDPQDLEDIPLAYHWLVSRPDVDPARSGLLGTCVGGSFGLMAAAHSLIRDQVVFASAYAPYSSMWTFARDIASESRCDDASGQGERHPWKVDQLTRKVFVHSITAWLEPDEAGALRRAFDTEGGSPLVDWNLSVEGQAIYDLLRAPDATAAEQALLRLPLTLQERLTAMSPVTHLPNLRAPFINLLHDVGDQVIPIGESRRLVAALGQSVHVDFTEMSFSHLDPVKGKLPFPSLLRELGKFLIAVYPLFRETTV